MELKYAHLQRKGSMEMKINKTNKQANKQTNIVNYRSDLKLGLHLRHPNQKDMISCQIMESPGFRGIPVAKYNPFH